MAVTVKQEVAALYSAIFNRAPDQAGLEFWVNAIEGGDSLVQAAEGFTQHPVFAETYAGLTNIEFVQQLYVNVLGSAGDAKGIQFWTDKLASGVSKGQVVAEFVQGSLSIDLDALLASGELSQAEYDAAVVRQDSLTNKANVGLHFVEKFGAATNLSADTDTTTKEGLESDPVYLASQAAIANVTADAASVTAAKAAIDAAQNPAELNVAPAFTLTQGLEALQAAQADLAAKLAAVATADLTDATEADGEAVTTDDPATTNVNELQVAVDAYSAEDAAAEVVFAAQAVADAEAGVLTAEAALTSARAIKFTDAKVLTLEGVTANTYMTDANVAAAVTEAQANVNAAKSLYLEDGTIVANETGVAQAGYQKIYLANNALTTDANAAGAVFKGYVASATNVVAADVTKAAGVDGADADTVGTPAVVLVTVAADYSGTLTIGNVGYTVTNGVVAGLDTYAADDVTGVQSIVQAGTTVTITGTLTDPDLDGAAEVATDLSNLEVTQTQPQTIFAAEDIVETVTAAQLQALAAAAEADLAADIANNGTNLDLLIELRAAINAYVGAEGAQTATTVENANLLALRGELATIIDNATKLNAEDLEAAAKVKVLALTTDTATPDKIALAGATATAEEKAVNDAFAAIAAREALYEDVTEAKANFEVDTATGSVLAAAEALQDARDLLVEAIADAQEDLADAQAYNESLTALIEAYAAAGDAVTAAEDALAELGVENLINLTDLSSNGTLFGADLFVYTAGTADATVARFEANDQLYIGKDFTFVTLTADDNLATDRLGSSTALEVFVKQNGNDVDFYIETETFAGNQTNVTDFEVVTLTGVTIADLSISGGFIAIA